MDIHTLRPRIIEILKASDLDSVSAKAVRKQLQKETTINLDEHKKPLNALIAECFDKVSAEMQSKDTSSSSSSSSSSSDDDDDTSLAIKSQTTTTTSNQSTVKKAAPKRKAKTESTKKVTKKPRKPRQQDPKKAEQNNFSRTWILSDDMAQVTGQKALSRPQVVKHIWKYIKENNLQDPEKKTHIRCDDKLTRLFEGETYISGFTMNKYVGKHLLGPAVVDTEPDTANTTDTNGSNTISPA
ncbi:SWIB-domain-containing protein [Lichtheimia hyalospora FSU 10163]|nr:SWIB-domain-containing protein [Lichtheimia hyalospora FSU 10163]